MSGGKLSLEITLGHGDIGALIRQQLASAIEAELAKLDVGKMIVERLTAPRAASSPGGLLFYGGYDSPVHASLLDELVSDAIRAEATAFINEHIEANRGVLEKRFAEMMRGSEKKLTKAFAKAMIGALDDGDWRFDLEAKVSTPTGDSCD